MLIVQRETKFVIAGQNNKRMMLKLYISVSKNIKLMQQHVLSFNVYVTSLYYFFVVILQFLGRSTGLDCDCKDLERCDIIAAGSGKIDIIYSFLN